VPELSFQAGQLGAEAWGSLAANRATCVAIRRPRYAASGLHKPTSKKKSHPHWKKLGFPAPAVVL